VDTRGSRPQPKHLTSVDPYREAPPADTPLVRETSAFTAIEAAALDRLLDGEHPMLATLRAQRDIASVLCRARMSSGYALSFDLPTSAPVIDEEPMLRIDDVVAEIGGLRYGARFVLFVRAGRLAELHVHTLEEAWPPCAELRSIAYIDDEGSPVHRRWIYRVK
jgi:hypothetical protein